MDKKHVNRTDREKLAKYWHIFRSGRKCIQEQVALKMLNCLYIIIDCITNILIEVRKG